jgi:hypothetical protein
MRHALMASLLLIACGEDEPPPRYPVTFEATSDHRPLEGVVLSVGQQVLGQTDADGVLHVDLTGPEGARVPITAQCPEGHRSPESLPEIVLRPVISLDPAAAARGIELSVPCPPDRRVAVVMVRTDGQADLPVYVDGRERARTDASGAAHVRLAMAPDTTFQVRLATTTRPLLRPQEPSMAFTLPDADQVFVFDQQFQVEEPPRRHVYRPRPQQPVRTLPVKIQSHGR